MKNIKVWKCKITGQILNHVTALISEQFSESWLDDSSRAKLGKHNLQKAEVVLEPCNTPISSHCLQIWDWTHIFLILVTRLISEQFLESWLDDSSCAKLGKRILQKAEEILEPCNTPILSHCLQIWDWTHIILILVTGLISKQFSKSRSDHLSLAKVGKHILQKALQSVYSLTQ